MKNKKETCLFRTCDPIGIKWRGKMLFLVLVLKFLLSILSFEASRQMPNAVILLSTMWWIMIEESQTALEREVLLFLLLFILFFEILWQSKQLKVELFIPLLQGYGILFDDFIKKINFFLFHFVRKKVYRPHSNALNLNHLLRDIQRCDLIYLIDSIQKKIVQNLHLCCPRSTRFESDYRLSRYYKM